jgi:hypothetical protein
MPAEHGLYSVGLQKWACMYNVGLQKLCEYSGGLHNMGFYSVGLQNMSMYCSLSLRRAAHGDKRMFLELIHGLFIT